MSQESRAKCAVNVRPITVFKIDGSYYNSYDNISPATRAVGCNEKTIRRALKKGDGLVKNTWRVVDTIKDS